MNWSPVVAALIALLGGLAFYRWQRTIERESEALRERRKIYRDYISAAESISAHIADTRGNTQNDRIGEYRTAFSFLQIVSPEFVYSAALKHRGALQEIIDRMENYENGEELDQIFQEEITTYEKLLDAMRRDNATTTTSKFGIKLFGQVDDSEKYNLEAMEAFDERTRYAQKLRTGDDIKNGQVPKDRASRVKLFKAASQYRIRMDIGRKKYLPLKMMISKLPESDKE
ncbi:hypothetical protein [Roseobacter sp. MH60115]|uniref:hypothetical protein n=1 Tax=Roseobacter sp. MH60115 TaxID=2785324 RepID=UPI0018A2E530|nr:hypothetical protein [Roseobacter sp. MH60115]